MEPPTPPPRPKTAELGGHKPINTRAKMEKTNTRVFSPGPQQSRQTKLKFTQRAGV